MSENRGELELYNQWFLLADLDRDGQLSGAEAVQFFQRSGLPQNPTLFKVWQHVAGDRPALNRQQFYTAMKLVSLAQANGGILDAQQAARLVNGLAGHVAPPSMEGLVSSPHLEGTAAVPAGQTKALPPAGSGVFLSTTGIDANSHSFPPLSSDQATAFQLAFAQLDNDGDGYVRGVDCFPAFMQSGLPQTVLKEVWDVVAGSDGQLSVHQFIQCLYLIDCAKRGIPIPKVLPHGQFPPVTSGVDLEHVGFSRLDLFSTSLEIPAMPARAAYNAVPPSEPLALVSQVPPVAPPAEIVSMLAAERARLDDERRAALQQEALQKQAEQERRDVAARHKYYMDALASLRLAQSKVARALVEAQQRLEMERAEADTMEDQYNAAYAEFSSEHVRAGQLLEALHAVQQEKTVLIAKLEALRTSMVHVEDFDVDWEARERAECEGIRKEIAVLAVKSESLQRSVERVKARGDHLRAAADGLKAATEGAEAAVASLQAEVDGLSSAAAKDGTTVAELLRRLAPLYNKLHSAAKEAMVPLPADALASITRHSLPPFKYNELHHAAGAASWDAFSDAGSHTVNILPADVRLEQLPLATTPDVENDVAATALLETGGNAVEVSDSTSAVVQAEDAKNDSTMELSFVAESNEAAPGMSIGTVHRLQSVDGARSGHDHIPEQALALASATSPAILPASMDGTEKLGDLDRGGIKPATVEPPATTEDVDALTAAV